jgi:hypothetical protein
MFSTMSVTMRWMGSVLAGTGAAAERVNESSMTMESRVRLREALGGLRAAQVQLASPDGRCGRDTNPVLAGEIKAAIAAIEAVGVVHGTGANEVAVRCKYGAALDSLERAERALTWMTEPKKAAGDVARRRALLHVRTAKWWVAPRATPRYGRVLAAR